MEFTAKTLARKLQGEVQGNPDVLVNSVAKIEEGAKGSLSFLANPKYEKYIYDTESSIVLVSKDFTPKKKIAATLIRVKDPYQAFGELMKMYGRMKTEKTGISDRASIHQSARIGKNVYIGEYAVISEKAIISDSAKIYPHTYIGNHAEVGINTVIYPGVSVYHECKIGANCIIHAGAVIGSDGFGFTHQRAERFSKIPQLGNVIIEDQVEIGANLTIDRATLGSTVIRKGVKLDNLIQIGHNVVIGENTAIAAQTGIAGSTKIGNDCILAGQVGIVGHLNIADRVIIGAQSGVTHDLKKDEIVLGSPAYDINQNRRSIAVYRKLPQLRNQVTALEKEIKLLKEKLDNLKNK